MKIKIGELTITCPLDKWIDIRKLLGDLPSKISVKSYWGKHQYRNFETGVTSGFEIWLGERLPTSEPFESHEFGQEQYLEVKYFTSGAVIHTTYKYYRGRKTQKYVYCYCTSTSQIEEVVEWLKSVATEEGVSLLREKVVDTVISVLTA